MKGYTAFLLICAFTLPLALGALKAGVAVIDASLPVGVPLGMLSFYKILSINAHVTYLVS